MTFVFINELIKSKFYLVTMFFYLLEVAFDGCTLKSKAVLNFFESK